VKSVFESNPQQSRADAGATMNVQKKEITESKSVFESIPLTQSNASFRHDVPVQTRTDRSVFESQPSVSSGASYRHGEPVDRPRQDKSVFESEPRLDSVATFRHDNPKPPSTTKSVFESEPKETSGATFRHDKPVESRKDVKTVFESQPAATSGASFRYNDPVILNAKELKETSSPVTDVVEQEQAHEATSGQESPVRLGVDVSVPPTVFQNTPSPGTTSASSLSPKPETVAEGKKIVYESTPSPSPAVARWDSATQKPAGSSVFENSPLSTSAHVSWKDSLKTRTTQSVFESVPQVSRADAAANRALNSEEEYEEESEEELGN